MTPPSLEAECLVAGYHKGRRSIPVVRVDHLAARAGELIAVLGPNGAGKSTLLRTLIGAQPPLAGRVAVQGSTLEGDGWTLRITAGWSVRAGNRPGDFRLVRNVQ